MAQLILKNTFKAYSREQFLSTAKKLERAAEIIEADKNCRIQFNAHTSSLFAPEARHPDALEAARELDRNSRLLTTSDADDITEDVWNKAAYISFDIFFNNERHRSDMSWGTLKHDKIIWKT
jgi:phosphoketolase